MEPIRCLQCNSTFPTKVALACHYKTDHVDFRPYECMLCGFAFKQMANLRAHRKRSHATYYGKGSIDKSQLLPGELSPDKSTFICSTCKAPFDTRMSLTRHYKLIHKDDNPHKCLICGHGAKQNDNLRYHMKTVHKDKNVTNSEAALPQVDSNSCEMAAIEDGNFTISCRDCEETFASRTTLLSHYRLKHDNGRPFKCIRCGNGFKKGSALKVHMKVIHKEGITTNSEAISTQLSSNYTINAAFKQEEEFTFCCRDCGATLASKTALMHHFKVMHENEHYRPFQCSICGFAFKQRSYLLKHTRNVHKVDTQPQITVEDDSREQQSSSFKIFEIKMEDVSSRESSPESSLEPNNKMGQQQSAVTAAVLEPQLEPCIKIEPEINSSSLEPVIKMEQLPPEIYSSSSEIDIKVKQLQAEINSNSLDPCIKIEAEINSSSLEPEIKLEQEQPEINSSSVEKNINLKTIKREEESDAAADTEVPSAKNRYITIVDINERISGKCFSQNLTIEQ